MAYLRVEWQRLHAWREHVQAWPRHVAHLYIYIYTYIHIYIHIYIYIYIYIHTQIYNTNWRVAYLRVEGERLHAGREHVQTGPRHVAHAVHAVVGRRGHAHPPGEIVRVSPSAPLRFGCISMQRYWSSLLRYCPRDSVRVNRFCHSPRRFLACFYKSIYRHLGNTPPRSTVQYTYSIYAMQSSAAVAMRTHLGAQASGLHLCMRVHIYIHTHTHIYKKAIEEKQMNVDLCTTNGII